MSGDAFKRNGLKIKLDDSESHLISGKNWFWDEMKEFCSKLISKPHPTALKKSAKRMKTPDRVKKKLDKLVGSVHLTRAIKCLIKK